MEGRAGDEATKPLNSWNEDPRRDNDAMDDVAAAAAITEHCATRRINPSSRLQARPLRKLPAHETAHNTNPASEIGFGFVPGPSKASERASALSETPPRTTKLLGTRSRFSPLGACSLSSP